MLHVAVSRGVGLRSVDLIGQLVPYVVVKAGRQEKRTPTATGGSACLLGRRTRNGRVKKPWHGEPGARG